MKFLTKHHKIKKCTSKTLQLRIIVSCLHHRCRPTAFNVGPALCDIDVIDINIKGRQSYRAVVQRRFEIDDDSQSEIIRRVNDPIDKSVDETIVTQPLPGTPSYSPVPTYQGYHNLATEGRIAA
jgi:hypothetical protein